MAVVALNFQPRFCGVCDAKPKLPRDAKRHSHGVQLAAAQGAEVRHPQFWEAMKKHRYVIADTLAGAIAWQFRARFST